MFSGFNYVGLSLSKCFSGEICGQRVDRIIFYTILLAINSYFTTESSDYLPLFRAENKLNYEINGPTIV